MANSNHIDGGGVSEAVDRGQGSTGSTCKAVPCLDNS